MLISPGLAPEPFSEPAEKIMLFHSRSRILISHWGLIFNFLRRSTHPFPIEMAIHFTMA